MSLCQPSSRLRPLACVLLQDFFGRVVSLPHIKTCGRSQNRPCFGGQGLMSCSEHLAPSSPVSAAQNVKFSTFRALVSIGVLMGWARN